MGLLHLLGCGGFVAPRPPGPARPPPGHADAHMVRGGKIFGICAPPVAAPIFGIAQRGLHDLKQLNNGTRQSRHIHQ